MVVRGIGRGSNAMFGCRVKGTKKGDEEEDVGEVRDDW
jgi:hypothetical protein